MTTDTVSYASATSHYASSARRDGVKRLLEEPVTTATTLAAMRRIQSGRPIEVVDLGCGTGDGYDLIKNAPIAPTFSYHGIDLDPDMIDAARATHDPGPTFAVDDIRNLPTAPPDIYVSYGVPFSHLSPEDFADFLAAVAEQANQHDKRIVLVIDVLGRYSIEWPHQWTKNHWRYPMSFFVDTDDHPSCDMTFHTPASLIATAELATDRTGARFTDWTFTDRSPLVGRHTTVSALAPEVPTYRHHLNTMLYGHPTARADLTFPRQRPDDPQARDAFSALQTDWEAIIEGHDFAAAPGSDWVNLGLQLLSATAGTRAAGIGHSLIATTTVAPAGNH